MSYTRRFTKRIAVHYSGTVSYPPSQTGGTRSYSGTEYENVEFIVHVDTDPFDEGVETMKHHVDLLTGSVVATEAAQVATKRETSELIGNTIVKGFFKTVKSDISQQIVELKNNADALLIQLNKQAEQCNDKRRQMGVDYQRLSERYLKIFEDLNKELENRIYSIDEPVFHTSRVAEESTMQGTVTDMVGTASISAGENARTASKITASFMKKRALEALQKAKAFLDVQYRTDALLSRCLREGGDGKGYLAPYCMLEATTGPGYSTKELFASPLLQGCNKDTLANSLTASASAAPLAEADRKSIADYFNAEVADKLRSSATDDHSRRVADMTSRLFDLSSTQSL